MFPSYSLKTTGGSTGSLSLGKLVTNAVRHAGSGGAVELWVSMEPERVCVAVVDQMPQLVPDLSSVGLPDDDAESGRGLAILVGVCDAVLETRTIRDGAAKVVSAKLKRAALEAT
jgi:anti-sigma regulatory factor (Ser/Thr protein kinase)